MTKIEEIPISRLSVLENVEFEDGRKGSLYYVYCGEDQGAGCPNVFVVPRELFDTLAVGDKLAVYVVRLPK